LEHLFSIRKRKEKRVTENISERTGKINKGKINKL
jgi:hypothetical protein